MSNTPPYDRIPVTFRRQQQLSSLGARLAHMADDTVDIELPWSEAIQQQQGFVPRSNDDPAG